MTWRRMWHPRVLLTLAVVTGLVAVVACGGTASPEQDAGATGNVGPTPTLDRMAAADEPTPTAALDATPTPVPVPTVMAVDVRPDWWIEGGSKLYRGDFPVVATSNPGFWDVHYGGSMNTVLVPSGPRFNQILEYNPVNPKEIIGDLAVS